MGGATKDFYKPTGVVQQDFFKKPATIFQSDDLEADILKCLTNGLAVIGQSDYVGNPPQAIELTKQARKVGARLVVFSTDYLDTHSGVRNVTVPLPDRQVTSQQSGYVTDFSGGGFSYLGQSTTTLPGGYSSFGVPFSYDRYQIRIFFLGQ